ncbi:MAG: hypothetical protein AAF990_23040 [Bacteroidota bacterium]
MPTTILSKMTLLLLLFFTGIQIEAQTLMEEKLDLRGAILKTQTKSLENIEVRNPLNRSRVRMQSKVLTLSLPDSNQIYHALQLSATTLSGVQYIDPDELPHAIHFLKVLEREYPTDSRPDSNDDIKYVTYGGMEMQFRYNRKYERWELFISLDSNKQYFNVVISLDKVPDFINILQQAINYIDDQN